MLCGDHLSPVLTPACPRCALPCPPPSHPLTPSQPKDKVKSINSCKSFEASSDVATLARWLHILAAELAERMAEDLAEHRRRPRSLGEWPAGLVAEVVGGWVGWQRCGSEWSGCGWVSLLTLCRVPACLPACAYSILTPPPPPHTTCSVALPQLLQQQRAQHPWAHAQVHL